MSELVSIIVPVYKVEQYLSRCVDSILQQSYSNLEIILVDDGLPFLCMICVNIRKRIVAFKLFISPTEDYPMQETRG